MWLSLAGIEDQARVQIHPRCWSNTCLFTLWPRHQFTLENLMPDNCVLILWDCTLPRQPDNDINWASSVFVTVVKLSCKKRVAWGARRGASYSKLKTLTLISQSTKFCYLIWHEPEYQRSSSIMVKKKPTQDAFIVTEQVQRYDVKSKPTINNFINITYIM